MNDYIADVETYPNCFLLSAMHAASGLFFQYEISDRINDSAEIVQFCHALAADKARMVTFNGVGFDYPILHMLLRMGRSDAKTLHAKCQAIIGAQDDNRWLHMVKPSDRIVEQCDLFLIHHFDNRARSTSLKALEFNMRAESIQDLPFPVNTVLTAEQILVLRAYNKHDVLQTFEFYKHSVEQIRFREQLSAKYGRDFLNHNDTKIGKDFFIMELEKAGIQCYDYTPEKGRTPRQTLRPSIKLSDAILPSIAFQHPELNRVLDWLKGQTVTETKNVFKDVTATVKGFELTFGLGGIHGSVENESLVTTPAQIIESFDIASFYPNLAIVNRIYPQHLGEKFCDVYRDLYEQRKQTEKGTAINATLKLALNGVFGDSGSEFSPFHDLLMMLRITLSGQLLICTLIDKLIKVPTLVLKMLNTDGGEYTVHPDHAADAKAICTEWERATGLQLEYARYSKMCITNVNNYIAVTDKGKIKRKGHFEYQLGWHQNFSALVIAKVAEQVLIHGAPIRETVEKWPDKMDFMLRVKVPRSSYLSYRGDDNVDHQIQNTSRYYVAKGGVSLKKWMPALKGGTEWRCISVEAGWKVCICNEMRDAVLPIDYSYYIDQVERICLPIL